MSSTGTLPEILNDSIGTGRVPNWRDTRTTPIYKQPTPATCNATATMTPADLLTGIVTSTTAAAVTATVPLGTDLETALQNLVPGLDLDDCFDFAMINTGATNILTIAANTGITMVGDLTMAPLTPGDQSGGLFRMRRTAANTFVCYRIA